LFAASSLDGGRITVYRTERFPGAILASSAQGGNEHAVYRSSVPGTILSLAVSPDGRSLLFVEADYTSRSIAVRVLPIDESEPRTVFTHRGAGPVEGGATWTHDGRYVLCWTNTSNEDRLPLGAVLWLIPASGGTAFPILAASTVTGLDISPDDRVVAFSARTAGRSEMWSVGPLKSPRTQTITTRAYGSPGASK